MWNCLLKDFSSYCHFCSGICEWGCLQQLVNFADSRLDMPPRASLLMLLGRRLQLPACTQAGVQLYGDVLEQGLVRVQLDLTGAYPAAAGHQRLLRTITLESVLMSATDQLEVLGLEPLEHCVLHRVEPHHFRDNRGEESCVWRWYWTPSTAEPTTEADAALQVGYRISPRLKHGVDKGVANGVNRPYASPAGD